MHSSKIRKTLRLYVIFLPNEKPLKYIGAFLVQEGPIGTYHPILI